jgi:methionyl-tRNA formyltransferase
MTATSRSLRIVFMGTPEFAVASLKALHQSTHEIAAVVTVPDKPAGRGRKLTESAVKQSAASLGVPILQPENLRDSRFIERLKEIAPDIMIVVAFRMLPEVVWSIPPLGTFNLHASLLPQYRGAAPINRAIMNGETTTGITTFFIDNRIDTGNILLQQNIPITPDQTAGELHDIMMVEGARLVLSTLNLIAGGLANPVPQHTPDDGGLLHAAPKIFREETRINWNLPIQTIYNHIRGLSPYPAAFFNLLPSDSEALQFKVFKAEILPITREVDRPILHSDNKSRIQILLPDGALEILDLQLQGRKRMATPDFLRGFRMENSWRVA